MKKKLLAIMMMLMLTLSLAACGGGNGGGEAAGGEEGGEGFAGGQTFAIKIGHSDTTENLIHKSLENFKAYVEEQSGGAVTVDIYAAEQLGSNAEMAEMVEMGSLDAMMIPQGEEAKLAPKINTLGLPFLFEDYESVYKVLDSEIGEELVADLADHNMIQLAYWENGLRQTTNSKRPLNGPDDFKGLKIRTPEDAMTIAIFEALGASPSPLAFSELYLALQQGTFDGQENPISNIHANNFQDVQKYLAMTNHKYECKNMIFSLTSWEKYPEDVQNLLKEAAKKFGDEHRQAIVDSQDQQLKELQEAGMEVTNPDIDALKEATASVYDDFYAENDWAEDLVNRIREKMAE